MYVLLCVVMGNAILTATRRASDDAEFRQFIDRARRLTLDLLSESGESTDVRCSIFLFFHLHLHKLSV